MHEKELNDVPWLRCDCNLMYVSTTIQTLSDITMHTFALVGKATNQFVY